MEGNIETSQNPEEPMAPPQPIVVGIGASAGGLAALKRFFEHVPAESDLAFVVVVHLSPEHKSHLADLLQPTVRFPVRQVIETTLLEPRNVYVIPPNANLSAIDTHLRLSKLEEQRRERAPIDHFFRTLASAHDGHAIGVILTGTGSDGTLGLKEIKAKGGVIIVQDPNEAEFDGMPQSAIATGMVDRVLPVAEIPDALLRFARTAPRVPLVEDSDEVEHADRILLPRILAILRARTDRDFSRYKPATILRRIARRMQLNYVEDLERYVEILREESEEARALADDLLITVTSFFRDRDVFERLEGHVIPRLFENKGPQDTIRIWSVGCATGEEAYSIAILLIEYAARLDSPPQIQVFASDLHKRSLDAARDGVYPGDIETDVSPDRLRQFFQKENGGFRIRKEVRDMVVFAPHNLLGDPPFSRVHLITCRNVLIYLERSVQRDVVDLFHYSLCSDGYLVLGTAETIDASDLFRTEDKKLCIYRKRNVPAPEPRLPVFPLTRMRVAGDSQIRTESNAGALPYSSVHQNLLELHAPPSMVVGPDNKLAHLSEHAGRYLMHPGGEVTSSILKLVRQELRIELLALLQSTRETKQPLDSRPIPVRFNGHPQNVIMHVRPAQDPEHEGFTLVMFIEQHQRREESAGSVDPSFATADAVQDSQRIGELETELTTVRQRLQAVIEEYETTQEEMKAANEEMQSSNEELRSTMEELETSKEELQSINEELQTVNQENRHKVEELSQLSSDLQNLLAATDIATLFLDRGLRIMRFTPQVAELFNVRVTDRGRPISDLTHRLGYAQLRADAEAVLGRLVPVEREIQDDAGRWYLTRVLPYRTTEDRIEGVVITFIDITTQKAAEREFNAIANLVPDLLWRSDPGGQTGWYNQRWYDYTGYRPENAGITWTELIHPDDRESMQFPYSTASQTEAAVRQQLRIRGADGKYRWFLVQARPIYDNNKRLVWWFGAATDGNQERVASEALSESLAEKEQLLKEVHHRVKNNLQIITSLLNLQSRQIQDKNALVFFEEARSRIQSIASIHELIYRSDSFAAVELVSYTRRLVSEVLRTYGVQSRIQSHVSGDAVSLELQRAIPFGLLLNELISNVCKHAFPSDTFGELSVILARNHQNFELTVKDTGVGLPAGFDYERAESLGLHLVRNLARQLRATIDISSKGGTSVVVSLPVQAVADASTE